MRARRHLVPLSIIVRFRALLAELDRTMEEIELLTIEVGRARDFVAWSRTRVVVEIERRVAELAGNA